MRSSIRTSVALSNTGVLYLSPNALAAQPKCVSSSCPRFIRDGTPIGFNTMSSGVPSSMCGISSRGNTIATTPLLPCRPAILSPSVIFRECANQTRTIFVTPGGNSLSSSSSRSTTETLMTLPFSPWRALRLVSLTSRAFSPKIARNSFSSAVSSVSPFGDIFPTNMSPGAIQVPSTTMPFSSRLARFDSPTLGISRVISSGPSFVSRASISRFSMWIDV